MGKENIISDFDGVWTNPLKESERFTVSYFETLSKDIGVDPKNLNELKESAAETIELNPGLFGWEYHDMIVAPAGADPYILNRTIAKLMLSQLRAEKVESIPSADEVDDYLNRLFSKCYPLTETVFREGALESLGELDRSSNLTIVTNSETTQVKRKLAQLFGTEEHDVRVIGNARKYIVDNRGRWSVGRVTNLTGLPRPVFLRRSFYNRVLEANGKVEKVIGDIYELDLALPEAKGIETILFASSSTPIWETEHYREHANGRVINSLNDLID